ncbi:unnamed protein product [Schistosoma rodhaini]|uniref:LsmAD domain-containing protein n=2 Tax=Schistosoma rodhaini TaxID=6188 RepID=A0AA85G1F6_9TREM|nr:unnamed protein product [Schistosoma rodhaini]CAH8601653.1 unnamed protein product [Schistosoma rodhaini]
MLSANVICKTSHVCISEELRRLGRKHFNQAHKRTSLFGSENEPQYFEEPYRENTSYPIYKYLKTNNRFTDEIVNKQSASFSQTRQVDNISMEHFPKTKVREFEHTESRDEVLESGSSDSIERTHEKALTTVLQSGEEDNEHTYSQEIENLYENPRNYTNGNIENDKVDYLIQAAEERAKRRELDKQNSNENQLLFDASQKPKRNPEYQRGLLNAPWYTNPEEGIGSENVQRYNSRSVKPISNSLQKISKSKSTTQQDFPKYSLQELKECRQRRSYHGNKESLEWPFSETNGSTKQEDELGGSHYHRSSAVIGQGFLEKFGPKSPSLNKKRTNDTPVAASMLRNSPYAFHG